MSLTTDLDYLNGAEGLYGQSASDNPQAVIAQRRMQQVANPMPMPDNSSIIGVGAQSQQMAQQMLGSTAPQLPGIQQGSGTFGQMAGQQMFGNKPQAQQTVGQQAQQPNQQTPDKKGIIQRYIDKRYGMNNQQN